MSYKYNGVKKTCVSCSVTFSTNSEDVQCLRCKGTKMKTCQKCKKKFFTGTGKLKCTLCRRVDGELTTLSYRNITRGAINSLCGDVKEFKRDILLLATKEKWGLLNYIDHFRICHIWLSLICDELRHSKNSPEEQIKLMMADLLILLNGTEKQKAKVKSAGNKLGRRKAVERLDEFGNVIGSWSCMKDCEAELDLNRRQIIKIINFGGEHLGFRLRWKSKTKYIDNGNTQTRDSIDNINA
jgi:hypothetical protein